MSDRAVEKTRRTAALYFEGVEDERPYDLWRAFDLGLARDLSLFITGQMYAREKLPHPTRQLNGFEFAVAAVSGEQPLRVGKGVRP